MSSGWTTVLVYRKRAKGGDRHLESSGHDGHQSNELNEILEPIKETEECTTVSGGRKKPEVETEKRMVSSLPGTATRSEGLQWS